MKTDRFSSEEVSRALDLIASSALERDSNPSDVIDALASLALPRPGARDGLDVATVEFVDRMRRIRLRRNQRVGADLFRDPGWDMLLELFTAHQRSRPLSVSSLCYSSGVPVTTALRQLKRLEAHGLVTKEGDQSDGRRCFVTPTSKAIDTVVGTVADLIDNFLAIQHESTRSI